MHSVLGLHFTKRGKHIPLPLESAGIFRLKSRIYRQRHPEKTVLYRVLAHHFEEFLSENERRFEKAYGFFRPIVKKVVEKYLDCGNPFFDCPSYASSRPLLTIIFLQEYDSCASLLLA